MYLRAMQRTCSHCGHIEHALADNCSRCNHPLLSPARIRSLGWLLLFLGFVLVGGMMYLMVLIAGIIKESNDSDATVRFEGDGFATGMIFGILSLVLLFGITSVVSGVWQIKYGRRNPKLIRVILFLGFIFIIVGTLIEAFG